MARKSKTTTAPDVAPASVVFQFAAARQRYSRSRMFADIAIASGNGWLALYEDEEPENERPPELPLAIDNKAAISLCLRWEINAELKRIQERVKDAGDAYAAHRLQILKGIIGDALQFLEPKSDDDDMLLARRLYENAERGREVRNEFTDVRKRRQAVRNG